MTEWLRDELSEPILETNEEDSAGAVVAMFLGGVSGFLVGLLVRGEYATTGFGFVLAGACIVAGWCLGEGGRRRCSRSSTGREEQPGGFVNMGAYDNGGRVFGNWERGMPAQIERLHTLCTEVNFMFAHRVEAVESFAFVEQMDRPVLVIGRSIGLSLTVEIEAVSGLYLFCEGKGPNDCTVITASEERLIDLIVSRAATLVSDLTPRTADAAVDVLIGRSLADIERRLILRTVRHFNGNRQQVALALGLSIEALQVKLRAFVLAAPHVPTFPGQQ